MQKDRILVGTGKGLLEWRLEDERWSMYGVHFQGQPVTVVYEDPYTGYWWAGVAHRHWGQKLHYSVNKGVNWVEIAVPKFPDDAQLTNGKRAVLKKIWAIQSAGEGQAGAMWVGTEPAAMFFCASAGAPFSLVEGLWNYPGRLDPTQWFGAGRDLPFLHSIVVNPHDSNHVYVAVSCAGIFETRDGGESWEPRNKGLIAAYLPNPQAEVGHDPHLLLACASQPEVMWQQNHCGIFRTTDGGKNWANVTDPQGIADYGFALAVDQVNTERAWVIPAVSDEERVAAGLALSVCRTDDGGKSWQALRNGLPQSYCFDIVFRHGLAHSAEQLAFGTTTGNIFYSSDLGENWQCLTNYAARVESMCFGTSLR